MAFRFAIYVVLAVGLLLLMWAGSLHVYDGRKMQDALRWTDAERRGQSPFDWTFEQASDLAHGHRLERLAWSGEAVRGELEDPYFYLNLQGRLIDARRFDHVEIRLHAAREGFLQLFHHQLREDQIHAGRPVPVTSGWQTLNIDLRALGWRLKDLSDPAGGELPSAWGGPRGLVSALRIDPVLDGAFAIDRVTLRSSGGAPPLSRDIVPFRTARDPLFARLRADPGRAWLLAHDHWLRTPETAHWTRRQVALELPSAIVFPRAPDAADLAAGPAPAAPLPLLAPGAAFCLAGLALLLRGRLPDPRRKLLEVAGLFTLIQATVWLMPALDPPLRLLPAAAVLGGVWILRPRPLGPALFGRARSWLYVAPLLALALVLLWLYPSTRPEPVSLPRTLAMYFLWALCQQFVVAVLFQSRLTAVCGPSGVVLGAALFGFLHFPNFALMAATFGLGLFLLPLYRRDGNLLALAAAQAFLAVSFNNVALENFWLSREVGPAFLARL